MWSSSPGKKRRRLTSKEIGGARSNFWDSEQVEKLRKGFGGVALRRGSEWPEDSPQSSSMIDQQPNLGGESLNLPTPARNLQWMLKRMAAEPLYLAVQLPLAGAYVVHNLAGEALDLQPFPGWRVHHAIEQIEDLMGNSRIEYHLVANNRRLDDLLEPLDTEHFPSGSIQVVQVELPICKQIRNLLNESDGANVWLYHKQLVKEGWPEEKVLEMLQEFNKE